MKIKRLPWPERLFIAGGLLLATVPNLLNEYLKMPDFLRGAVIGIGLGMEIGGFIMLKRRRNAEASPCGSEIN